MAASGFWQIDIGDLLTVGVGGLGLLGLYFAYRQLRIGQRAQQTQLIMQLYQEFSRDDARRAFLYKLEYSGPTRWVFDSRTFPLSDGERHLDSLLYFLAFVGNLARHGDLSRSDLDWMASECRIILGNPDVQEYLRWLRLDDQLPDHTSFADAIYLYAYLLGPDEHYRKLNNVYHGGRTASEGGAASR